MPLSLKQLQNVCNLHNGGYRRCKYLARDDFDSSKWYFLKKTSKKKDIDDETMEYLKELQKKLLDPKKQDIPIGDNCEGYPVLRRLEQGYDKD